MDPIGSDAEAVGFELDGLRRDGDRGLEVRGRWSGVRGRRFVRPTLIVRIDGTRHRLLADLEHKPWAAEDGQEWVALFSPVPPAGKADRIELSVAPDITVSLSAPGSRSSPAKVRRPVNGTSAPPRRKAPAERPRPAERARPAQGTRPAKSTRPADGTRPPESARPAERERPKTPDLVRELETAAAERARLLSARDALVAERDELRLERDALIVERDGLRRQQTRARKRLAELQDHVNALEAKGATGLAEARSKLEAQQAETGRLRAALEAHEAHAGDADGRLARELVAVSAERDRLAQQANHARAVRPEAVTVRRALPARSPRRAPVWGVRTAALTAMVAVLLAFAHALHYV
ncbi:MAG TPA: hypothetical protein VG186_04460 [Solirubrobacteraceae bacterium]|nr:hypothetical protein [Solirubrobacteraceae bacterium]